MEIATAENESRLPSHIVGVGASAGGLEALQAFFGEVAVQSGAAFVVVQHLSPDFRSVVDELLARHTDIPICTAEDGMTVEPNTIYLMPPRVEMILHGGKLLLTSTEPHQGLSLPIDRFFRSIAQDFSSKGVGVVLSGTGSDGSRGIRDIHEAGGLVIAQTPESAKFDGMPRTARDSGVCDFVLPPDRIAAAIHRHLGVADAKNSDDEFRSPLSAVDRILVLLHNAYGIDFSHYKAGTITRRLDRRVILTHSRDLDEFCTLLENDPQELDALYHDILVGVTHFFRDPAAWRELEEQIDDLVEQSADNEELRVWIAGCATGEEAYTVAICLVEALERLRRSCNVRIFATDVHQRSIDHASAGRFLPESLREIGDARLERFFQFDGTNYTVAQDLRKLIVFARHNIIDDAPFTNLSLVTCRNLLIYLDSEMQQEVLSLFQFGLKTGGVLMLGSSEHLGSLDTEFDVVSDHWKIYQKRRHARLPAEMIRAIPPRIPQTRQQPFPIANSSFRGDLLALYDSVLATFVPMAFLVNESRELVHSFGGASRFLHFRDGRQDLDICDAVIPELRPAMINALQQAPNFNQPLLYPEIRIPNVDGSDEIYSLLIRHILDRKTGVPACLVELRLEGPATEESPEPIEIHNVEATTAIENELRYTRENLQATIEELETSNEELQATNEELIASNEELQSTNEELNSVNEELYTVNAEYQKKINELTDLTNDMENLLVSTEIGTIFLDEDLNIRQFTPRAADYADLMPQDIGRPIDTFSTQLNDPVHP